MKRTTASSNFITVKICNSLNLLLLIALVTLAGCSSTPDNSTVTYAPLPAPADPANPIFLGAGVAAGAASGMVMVDAIDYTNRTCVLARPDGETMTFQASPDMVNFNQVKVGDSLMSTVSKNFVAYLVKGGVTPSSITNYVAAGKPQGTQPGAVMIRNVDYHAKVLVINYATRRVVLQFGKNQAQEIQAGPGVSLDAVHVNDDVYIRTTEALAIAVVPH